MCPRSVNNECSKSDTESNEKYDADAISRTDRRADARAEQAVLALGQALKSRGITSTARGEQAL